MSGLHKSIIDHTNQLGNGTNVYKSQMNSMNKIREAMQGNVAALDTYRLRQGQVLSAEDAYQKKIREGKATFADMYKNRKMFNTVLRDQLALQQSVGMGWSQSTKTGKFTADMFIDKALPAELNNLKNRFGLLSSMVNSASGELVNWGKNTQWAGRQLMVGFTVPLGIAAGAMGKMAYDLDKQVTQVVKVYGDASSAINSNSQDIRETALATASAAARVYGQSAQTTLGIMADLAASGKAGMELQQATMATSRAAILGELDWQDAVKATISMQSVYHSSQEDLANNWNYINAMENQTVLSAQDFVTAIPKVSGVMNELGATLQDTGSLLTAFKASGIDAAEGANALKSINFRTVAAYGKGVETFNAMTGKDLKAIVDETNGQTIPTLMKFADAIKNLSNADKMAVTRDVFGIYQGSKALMLLEQMTSKTEQWQQALDVANNSNIENAAIAQQELDRQSEQPFKKLQMAIESIKIDLAKMGEAFLTPAVKIVEVVQSMVKWFNDLNPAIKNFAMYFAAAIAVAGPIVMLIGLFANLAGTIMKFGSRLALMATGWKNLSEEERLQQIISKESVALWDSETTAAARLTVVMKELAAAFTQARNAADLGANSSAVQKKISDAAAAHLAAKNLPENPTLPYKQGKNGTYYDAATGYKKKAADAVAANNAVIASYNALIAKEKEHSMAVAEAAHAADILKEKTEAQAAAQAEAATAAEAAAQRTLRATRLISGAALGAGIIGSMVGPQDGIAGAAMQAVNAFSILGMVAPQALVKIGKGVANYGKNVVATARATTTVIGQMVPALGGVGTKLGNIGKSTMNGIKSTAMSMLGYLKVAGPIVAAVGLAAYLLIKKWNDEIDKSRKKTEDAMNFAKNTADILGYSYTNAAGLDPNTIKDGQKAAEVIAEKIKQNNAEMAQNFKDAAGQNPQDQWRTAIAAGIDAKLHGATVDQAKSTVRAALQIMGQSFSDAEFEIAINPKIDFNSANDTLNAQLDIWNSQISNALKAKPVNFWEEFNNTNELSQNGGAIIQKVGKDFWDKMMNTPKGERRALIQKVANENDKFMNDAFKAAQAKNPAYLKANNINNAHDFGMGLAKGTFTSKELGMAPKEFAALKKKADGLRVLTQAIAAQANVSDDAKDKMATLWDLLNDGTFASFVGEQATAADKAKTATEDYDFQLNRVIQSGQVMTAERAVQIQQQVRIADGTYKLGAAMQYFGDVAAGAAIDAETFNDKLKELGYNSTVTFDSVNSSWKNIMSGAQDAMFAEAARQYDEYQQGQMEALQARGQAALDAIEKQGEELDNKQQKATQALEDRLDAAKKAFDKAQEDRKKRESDLYDARVKKIEEAIKAEQDAEDQRQKIFEAEQTRIQRLAQMYSTNVDINMAINSGKMDEAAKLAANANAQTAQWATSDAAGDSKSASDKKIEALNKEKDAVGKAKDARLEALKETQDAEKDAFQKSQDRQKQELKDAQDLAKKKLDADKKRIQAENTQKEKALRDDQARNKRNLESQLAVMRAFLPRNEAELSRQSGELQKVYGTFGMKLTGEGNKWAGAVSKALRDNVAREGNALRSTVDWSKVGTDIAKAMIQGAFGMTPAQFAAWLNGGDAPVGTPYGKPKPANKPKHAGQIGKDYSMHSGGVVGHDTGSRVGYSGEKKPSEVMINALYGEGVVNRRGMKMLGKAGLDQINSGGGMGGGGLMGVGDGVPATIIGATSKMILTGALKAAYNKRMGRDVKGVGADIGVKPDYSQILGNAASSIANTIYQTGHVVYLGHNNVNAGGDYSGLLRPIPGPVASEFGPRNLFGMSFHNGIDIMAPVGTPIHAAKGGKVIFTGWDSTGYGNYTEIQAPDGSMYGYGHQSQIGVRAGMNVATGQQIGLVGNTGNSTGPHLHFQIGNHGNWFNPRQVMPQLNTGGFIKSDGLAKLHKEEVVLTKPLTQDLKDGVRNLANGNTVQYNVTLDFNGASFDNGIDFQQEVETALRNIDRKNGGNRKIGGR